MSLDANALVSLATAKGFLLTAGTENDSLTEDAINAASAAVEDYCKRQFKKRAVVAERVEGPWGQKLYLRVTPLDASATVTVTVNEIVETVWRSEADGQQGTFQILARPDHLYRRGGWAPSYDPYNVLVSYTGGYTTIPSAVQRACLYMVQKLFRDSQRQLAEVASVNTPMGSISILDNALPRMAQMLLGPYKFLSVA